MNVIRHLGIVGVNLGKVEILDYFGVPLGTANEFLASNTNWRKRIDETGNRYRQSKDVEQLVEDRIAHLKSILQNSGARKVYKDEELWSNAYRSVCVDLAIAHNDPSWRTHAEKNKAMPRRKAPEPPRRKPPRPTTPHPSRFARV